MKKELIKESKLKQLIMQWIMNYEKNKLKKLYQNDPELQKTIANVEDAYKKFSDHVDDYCKKHDC